MRRPEDDRQAGAPAAKQHRLAVRAVVEPRVGQHDIADRHPAQPADVLRRGERRLVEEGVLREVVLPEPTTRERDAGARELQGRPMADGVHGLDPVGRAGMGAEEGHRRLPIGRAPRGRAHPVDEARGQWREVQPSRQADGGKQAELRGGGCPARAGTLAQAAATRC